MLPICYLQKEWLRNKEENMVKQKEQAEIENFRKLQKPASV